MKEIERTFCYGTEEKTAVLTEPDRPIGEYLSAFAEGFNLEGPVWLSSADGSEPIDLGTLPDKTPRNMRVNELQEMTAARSEGAEYRPSGEPVPKVVWVG